MCSTEGEDMVVTKTKDEWDVSLKEHVTQLVENTHQQLAHLHVEMMKIQEQFGAVLNKDTPKEAAEILVDRYLSLYSGRDKQLAIDAIANKAGDSLRTYVYGAVKPEVLCGMILERAGVDLAGNNGPVGKIKKAAAKLANNPKFIEELVKRELKRVVRVAVSVVVDEIAMEALAAQIVERLQPKLSEDAIADAKEYLDEALYRERSWLQVDLNHAASVAVNKILRNGA